MTADQTDRVAEVDGQDVEVAEVPQTFVGDHVRDRDRDGGPLMVVTGHPLQRCATYTIDSDGTTIADLNEDYPETDHVVEVRYASRTDAFLCENRTYAFPEQRLEVVHPIHDVDGDGEGSDAE